MENEVKCNGRMCVKRKQKCIKTMWKRGGVGGGVIIYSGQP